MYLAILIAQFTSGPHIIVYSDNTLTVSAFLSLLTSSESEHQNFRRIDV